MTFVEAAARRDDEHRDYGKAENDDRSLALDVILQGVFGDV